MAHREFLDAEGTRWDVWEVNPARVERELEHVRALVSSRAAARGDTARRHATVSNALSSGWLCFESGDTKRRLAPIPEGWQDLASTELSRLCRDDAVPVRKPRSGGASGGQAAQQIR